MTDSPTRAAYRRLLRETPVLAAPMCGISDFAYRQACREAGARLTFTQMISAEALWRGDRKSLDILELAPGESPVAVQLFGAEPESMARAAEIVQDLGVAVIDVNMGCPARKIVSSRSGAALLRDPDRARRVLRAMRRAARVPLTVKTRWDWDDGQAGRGSALEILRVAEDEGVDGLCLHARTREQGYSGTANWELIAEARRAAPDMPLVGNGDVRTPADALEMLRRSGCDAVMIGRAAIGDPWLLGAALRVARAEQSSESSASSGDASLATAFCGPSWPERRATMLRHAGMMAERRGARGVVAFRKHAAAYLRGLPGAKRLRVEIMRAQTLEDLARVLNAATATELAQDAPDSGKPGDQEPLLRASQSS